MNGEIYLLPGWPFKAQVMHSLASALQHHGFSTHCLELPWHARAGASYWLEALVRQIPAHAWVLGWSLGGMLAQALAQRPDVSIDRVITLGTNARFTQASEWNSALPADTLHHFTRGFSETPDRVITRFLALCAHPQRMAPTLKQYLSDAPVSKLANGLRILDELDNRFGASQCHHDAFLAEHDALVPLTAGADMERLYQTYFHATVLPATTHSGLVTDPAAITCIASTLTGARP